MGGLSEICPVSSTRQILVDLLYKKNIRPQIKDLLRFQGLQITIRLKAYEKNVTTFLLGVIPHQHESIKSFAFVLLKQHFAEQTRKNSKFVAELYAAKINHGARQ